MRPIKPTDNSDNKLDSEFRRKLRNSEVAPPAGLWDRLETDLDHEREQVRYDHWYYAGLILLIPVTLFNVVFNFDVGQYYDQVVNGGPNARPYHGTYHVAENFPGQLTGMSDYAYLDLNNLLDFSVLKEAPPIASAGYHANNPAYYAPFQTVIDPAQNNNQLIAGINKKPQELTTTEANNSLFRQIQEVTKAPATVTSSFLAEVEAATELNFNKASVKNSIINKKEIPIQMNPLGVMRGLYFGGVGVIQNTRIFLMNDALYPLVGKDISFNFDVGYQYGITVGYNFSHRWALEAQWIISSAQGQRYVDNRYGKLFIHGDIQLNYTQLPVMVKYRFSRMGNITKLPISFNLVAGMAYSRMRSASMTLNEDVISNAEEFFARNEIGLIMGMEYDVYATRNMFVTMGLRGSVYADTKSLKHMRGDSPRIYNFLVGVHAGINFQLPSRRKSKVIY